MKILIAGIAILGLTLLSLFPSTPPIAPLPELPPPTADAPCVCGDDCDCGDLTAARRRKDKNAVR